MKEMRRWDTAAKGMQKAECGWQRAGHCPRALGQCAGADVALALGHGWGLGNGIGQGTALMPCGWQGG